MENKLGGLLNPVDLRDIPASVVQSKRPLPKAYQTDISMIPVYDQGQLGTCVAFATASYLSWLNYKETGEVVNLSKRYLYALSKKIDGYDGQGTFPRIMDSIVRSKGDALMSSVSENIGNHEDYIAYTPDTTTSKQALTYRVKSTVWLNGIEEVKRAIYEHGTCLVTITVGNYENGYITPDSQNKYYHRVWVYGYDEKYLYIRNSWGINYDPNRTGNFTYPITAFVADGCYSIDLPNTTIKSFKVIKFGDKGERVKELQRQFVLMGYRIVIDGVFGNKTKDIVKDIQRKNGLIIDGVVGGKTMSVINKNANAPVYKIQNPENIADIALKELGVSEYIKGSNPRIVEYHKYTTLKATNDETPWCSSFVNFCAKNSGYESTNSAMARSWLEIGTKVDVPKRGDIAIFSRGAYPTGHVAIILDWTTTHLQCIGGNQSDKVSIEWFSKDKLLGIRKLKHVGIKPKETMNKIPEIIQSSDGTGNLSTTIKGVLVGLVPAILIIARYYNLELSEMQVLKYIEDATLLISTGITTYGLLKKIINTKKSEETMVENPNKDEQNITSEPYIIDKDK